ncbi:MAG: hypothetical protein ACR2OF_05615 [Hyphomicrobium sp.]
MTQLSSAFIYTIPARAETVEPEERWPLGLSVAFVIASSILLWLPIIACIRWLLSAF